MAARFFYLLTGKPPFQGEDAVETIRARLLRDVPSVRKSRPEISLALERVVAKMMAYSPAERYQTPGEVAKALESHTQGERPFTVPKTESTFLQEDSPRKPRRQITASAWIALAGAMAIGTVALLGILVGAFVFDANKGTSDSKPGMPTATLTQEHSDDIQSKDTVGEFRKFEIEELPTPKKPDPQATPPTSLPQTQTVDVGGGVQMEFVLIPKGNFTMGSPPGEKGRNPWEKAFDAEEQHEVEITKPFYMAKYSVTQEQYLAITGKKIPTRFSPVGVAKDKVGQNIKQFPVDDISWEDAKTCCATMTKNYKLSRKFRLPTEAEWEYACRAGTKTAYCFGDDPKNLGDYAWFYANSRGWTHEVGTKRGQSVGSLRHAR